MGKHSGKGIAGGRKRRSVFGWVGEILLTILSIFGVVCVAAVIAAWVFGVNIMMFKTGSMAPGIPAGSVALVREIPAAEADIGNVITVQRPGQLPITHRVISNEPDPAGGPEDRIIEMKGDANPQPDPVDYRVSEVQLLFWSQPEWGHTFARLADPKTLAIVTMLAALVVTWAFWPRGREGS
ncbi:signal peptidase I [Corynebacterium halotolerans]|uniref:signal peptidase I n=1 Tax=Corynebacterium halotolerans TaxID=225326 RepID=UPI003CFA4628